MTEIDADCDPVVEMADTLTRLGIRDDDHARQRLARSLAGSLTAEHLRHCWAYLTDHQGHPPDDARRMLGKILGGPPESVRAYADRAATARAPRPSRQGDPGSDLRTFAGKVRAMEWRASGYSEAEVRQLELGGYAYHRIRYDHASLDTVASEADCAPHWLRECIHLWCESAGIEPAEVAP